MDEFPSKGDGIKNNGILVLTLSVDVDSEPLSSLAIPGVLLPETVQQVRRVEASVVRLPQARLGGVRASQSGDNEQREIWMNAKHFSSRHASFEYDTRRRGTYAGRSTQHTEHST